jgi:uncharacterized membrane protein YhiD involved in acid resistance
MPEGLPVPPPKGPPAPLFDGLPEWLQAAFTPDAKLQAGDVAIRFGLALALGCVVAGIYRLSYGKPRGQSVGLMASLVLLSVLIGMVTLAIGNSLARAFSLAGVLAIVRFRTVVEDTRDTAFVIFAVAVGMAVGAGYAAKALIGIPFAAAAAFLFRPRDPRVAPLDFSLIVRLGVGHAPDALLRETFGKHLDSARLTAVATARQGVAFDFTYTVRLRHPDAVALLVADLNAIEGVQNVELRQA